MPKFRKKPVIIDALAWNGNKKELREWVESFGDSFIKHFEDGIGAMRVCTLEGKMIVSNNDAVIRGVKGEYYACHSDIFELTYEAVI